MGEVAAAAASEVVEAEGAEGAEGSCSAENSAMRVLRSASACSSRERGLDEVVGEAVMVGSEGAVVGASSGVVGDGGDGLVECSLLGVELHHHPIVR